MSITAIAVLMAIFVPFGLIGAAVIWCAREDAVRGSYAPSEPVRGLGRFEFQTSSALASSVAKATCARYPHLLAATPWRTIFVQPKAFTEAGALVALADHREASVRTAAKQLVAAGHKALAIRCDVADERQAAVMVEQTVSAFEVQYFKVAKPGVFCRRGLFANHAWGICASKALRSRT